MELMKMSAQEIVLLKVFNELAEEAFKASKLIEEKFGYSFGPKNKSICVYRTESCGEYIGYGYYSIDNEFTYQDNWWGGRSYKFSCDPEGIYKMLRSCYLREHDLASLDPEKFNCEIEHLNRYFREFIQSLEKGGSMND